MLEVAINLLHKHGSTCGPDNMAACLPGAELPETSAAAQRRGKKRVPGNAGARLRNELKRKSLAAGELVDCLQA